MASATKGATEPVWTDGRATGNRATREAIGLRLEADGTFYFCLQSSPEDTPELTGALEADMSREQVEGMLRAVRTPLERRWPFAEEPATHALEAESVHYELRAPWGVVHEHDLPDKQVFVTVHNRKDQDWLAQTLEEALRVMAKHPRKPRPAPAVAAEPAPAPTSVPSPATESSGADLAASAKEDAGGTRDEPPATPTAEPGAKVSAENPSSEPPVAAADEETTR